MSRPWVGLALVAAMLAVALAVFPVLPDRIPTHWNVAGEPDAWTSKWPAAFLGPAVALAIWVLLRLLPGIDPRIGHYARFRAAYWRIGNYVIAFMLVVQAAALGEAAGWPVDVTRLILVGMGALLLGVGYHLPRVRSNWWMGIRTPWTLESERVWRDTHRLAGRTFVAGGLVTIAGAFAPAEVRPFVAMSGIGVAAMVPVVYSYFAWRRERREGRA